MQLISSQIQDKVDLTLPIPDKKTKTLFDDQITPSNTWKNINLVPACKLRHIIPQKLIEKDQQGVSNIMEKTQEIEKLNNWVNNQKIIKRYEDKQFLLKRHDQLKNLENKSGIKKIYKNNLDVGKFGIVRKYNFSQKIEELSRPKTLSKNNSFQHEDFRGLLHADYSLAIIKVNDMIENSMIKKKNREEKEKNKLDSISDVSSRFSRSFISKGSTVKNFL